VLEVAGAEVTGAEEVGAGNVDVADGGGVAVQPARRMPVPMTAAVRVWWRMRSSN